MDLFLEFLRIETINNRTKLSENDYSILFRIIDSIPLEDILRKIIFARYKYNILIKHEAVIRAIDLQYSDLLNEILLESADHDLVKTVISQSMDDALLSQIAKGGNNKIPAAKLGNIQKLALQRILDNSIFLNTAVEIMDQTTLYTIFQKLQKRASLRGQPRFYIRLIPVILYKIQTPEVINEFEKDQKYPQDILSTYHQLRVTIDQKH